jgi:hypothetical protein
MKRLLAFLAALVASAPLATLADPPGRVGRISFIQGEVALFADPELGWEAAYVNSHVTSENSVWTEPGARTEVRVGSTALRLEEGSQLDVARLDDDTLRAHLARGRLAVRIRFLESGETYTFTTADARFQLRSNGRFRLDADPERGESRLTVFSGSALLDASGGFVQVEPGSSVRVTGGARPSYSLEPAYSSPLDEWALARDERFAQREASRYVSPRMTGWEDLDEYGEWRSEPEYGTLWFPTRVEAGWVPYRDGRWTWVRPWGWTWVDAAPWGYAPFHYGRWVHVHGRWGWYPGRYVARPVWAPALVAWVGGPGWSVSVGAGGPASVIGWYPLSPYDRYVPWYQTNVTYVNRINQVTIINRPGQDRRWDRDGHPNRVAGATVVARENFVSRRPVHGNVARVPGEVVQAQPVSPGVAVLPSRREIRPHAKPLEISPEARSVKPFADGSAGERTRTPGAPAARPMPVAPAAPTAAPPSAVARPPHAFERPVPGERALPAQRVQPSERAAPVDRPAPSASGGMKPMESPAVRAKPAEALQNPAKPVEALQGEPGTTRGRPVSRESPAQRPQEAPAQQSRAARESRESRGAAPAVAPVEARPGVVPAEVRGKQPAAPQTTAKPVKVEPQSDKDAKPGMPQPQPK